MPRNTRKQRSSHLRPAATGCGVPRTHQQHRSKPRRRCSKHGRYRAPRAEPRTSVKLNFNQNFAPPGEFFGGRGNKVSSRMGVEGGSLALSPAHVPLVYCHSRNTVSCSIDAELLCAPHPARTAASWELRIPASAVLAVPLCRLAAARRIAALLSNDCTDSSSFSHSGTAPACLWVSWIACWPGLCFCAAATASALMRYFSLFMESADSRGPPGGAAADEELEERVVNERYKVRDVC
jgi:hypothetical protein